MAHTLDLACQIFFQVSISLSRSRPRLRGVFSAQQTPVSQATPRAAARCYPLPRDTCARGARLLLRHVAAAHGRARALRCRSLGAAILCGFAGIFFTMIRHALHMIVRM